jgi:glycerophosphoryl diester phosphodiesterase
MDFVYLKWAFAGYFATSLLCFIFPSLLRTKKKYSFQPFNEAVELKKILKIAHRGAPRYITENTIESFKKAVEAKADMLEMDVCETKDGILVVHHDHDLERTCGVKDKIRDLEFNKLPSFLPTISLNFSKGLTVKSNGEKISTLEQIFK